MAAPTPTAPAAHHTLVIDIGGTGLKMIVLDEVGTPVNERTRELTPSPAAPRAVMKVLAKLLTAQPSYARVSVGFPGVVQHGVVRTAPNLGTKAWRGFELEESIAKLTGKPTRAVND
ncbi:MAG: ROK family protein, partial [Pseudomonadota bacterium]